MSQGEAGNVWARIVSSNRAWFEGRPCEVASIFHPEVVLVSGGEVRLRGREAMVQSYVDYCGAVKTHAFAEGAHSVELFGASAIVNYLFRVEFEVDGAVQRERGEETLVLVRWGGELLVRWRTQTFLPWVDG